MIRPILVTGGCGFIGSNFIRHWLETKGTPVVNVDALTYAGNLHSLFEAKDDERHIFIQANINDSQVIRETLATHQPKAIIHFAAESHVDRSILNAEHFIQTNVVGTFRFLEEVKNYWYGLNPHDQKTFKYIHMSTDEVFGSLRVEDLPFTEESPYQPNSPYSATKAAGDHLVRAWHQTHNLPTITVYCSNNYGPAQFPEKLIPLMLLKALKGESLPLYGNGQHIRDWIYVKDLCEALCLILEEGKVGEKYCIGGESPLSNQYVVETICCQLNHLIPLENGKSYASHISYVTDRPGHDYRYALDTEKISKELGWKPKTSFQEGIRLTINWYLANEAWVKSVQDESYRQWMSQNYGARLVA